MVSNCLTRDNFRESVFARDDHKCVICGDKAQDAHHIIERRLFSNGGYYLDNGASVCGDCHLKCEQTLISCEELRERIGIPQSRVVLPEHLYSDTQYDKWGNIVLANGRRLKGDLFFDESVQKVLQSSLELFTHHVKYPRTYHLPWSENVKKDDRIMASLDGFLNKEVVVTIKMDGENTTMYSDFIHARSLNANPHPSRNWVKTIQAKIAVDIPEGWRICGENLYAKHSIFYQNLTDYFQVFSIWNDRNNCLSWDETLEWTELLGLQPVPILYRGIWDEQKIKSLFVKELGEDECEGYVVRIADNFAYGDFRKYCGKFVRKDHVQTHGHWIRSAITPNKLRRT